MQNKDTEASFNLYLTYGFWVFSRNCCYLDMMIADMFVCLHILCEALVYCWAQMYMGLDVWDRPF